MQWMRLLSKWATMLFLSVCSQTEPKHNECISVEIWCLCFWEFLHLDFKRPVETLRVEILKWTRAVSVFECCMFSDQEVPAAAWGASGASLWGGGSWRLGSEEKHLAQHPARPLLPRYALPWLSCGQIKSFCLISTFPNEVRCVIWFWLFSSGVNEESTQTSGKTRWNENSNLSQQVKLILPHI